MSGFIPLNLPEAKLQIENQQGLVKVLDLIRKKYVALTPEEWVRQHLIHFLLSAKKYPKSLFQVEKGLSYNRMTKRTDIVVYDRQGKPFLLVECKSPMVKISEATFRQAAMYNNTLQAPYFMLSNGLVHYCCSINHHNQSSQMLKELPEFPDLD
jgi:type I site-specific restriction endonuclease